MYFNIEDFLPKYPNIENKSLKDFMNPYNNLESFNQRIYNKNEFYSLRLQETENIPKEGELFNHQKIIARFLSGHTIYDALLLIHEMGTGKSCAAFGAIEEIRNSYPGYKGAVVLTKGERIGTNLMKELAYVCTKNKYNPDETGDTQLTENMRKRRLKSLTSVYYSFNTFEIFAKKLARKSDDDIVNEFSNKVLMIDEVHNLRLYGKSEDSQIYIQIHRLFHLVKNCKKIIMSGTPMKDDPNEIATMLNLILPIDKQLPTGKAFTDEYLESDEHGIEYVKENKKDLLKSYMNGRVSFLRSMSSVVKIKYVGEVIPPLTKFIVLPNNMIEPQLTVYKTAYDSDKQTKGIYTNSRQATLFVFPDGSYGKEGLRKNIKNIIRLLRGNTEEETLERIRRCSSIYYTIIKFILENKNKSTFVYASLVGGSGSILLGKLLELFNYGKANGSEQTKHSRYAILASKTNDQVSSNTERIIRRFNKKDNLQGEFIQVVIGSRIVSEGITLKNVQQIHIATPHWNYSELAQAIARGIRLISHEDLINAGITPEVQIYQHVSMSEGVNSIDLDMYNICEKKDISIKNVERLVKEIAFDCALFYKRNRAFGTIDNTRECEYQQCDYTCDGINNDDVDIDYSTFELYYADEVIQDAIQFIKNLFRIKTSYTTASLVNIMRTEFNMFEIVTALRKIISNNISITNLYGFDNYLRDENNILFLVDNLSVKTYLSSTYTKYPVVLDKPKSIDEIIIPKIQYKISLVKEGKEFGKYITLLPKKIQDMYLELAQSSPNETPLKKIIIDYFIKPKIPKVVKEHSYKYEGLLNTNNEKFCIKPKGNDGPEDSRIIKTGRVCTTMKRDELEKISGELGITYETKTDVKKMCNILKDWFEAKGILKEDLTCGIKGGHKKSA